MMPSAKPGFPIPNPLSASSLALWFVAVVTVSFGPLSAVRADDTTPPKTVAFVGASLVDGTGKALQSNSAIFVRGARIVAVGPVDEIHIPSDAKVVHVDGRFIIPGLINSHVHLATLANPREARALAALTPYLTVKLLCAYNAHMGGQA